MRSSRQKVEVRRSGALILARCFGLVLGVRIRRLFPNSDSLAKPKCTHDEGRVSGRGWGGTGRGPHQHTPQPSTEPPQSKAIPTPSAPRPQMAEGLECAADFGNQCMNDLPPLIGIPLRDADAAQRGFLYQAVVAALAWVRLRPHERLLIEAVEDVGIVNGGSADLTQVKDRAATLTISGVIDWLDDVVRLASSNPAYTLTFVYISTSAIGLERSKQDRPNGKAALKEWNCVKVGACPAALLAIVRRLAAKTEHLAKFLQTRSDEQVVRDLIQPITWAAAAPKLERLELDLQELVAQIAHEEFGAKKYHARELAHYVTQHIVRRSTRADRTERELGHDDLRELLRPHVQVGLSISEYDKMHALASAAEATGAGLFDEKIQERLAHLRTTRFFTEARVPVQAAELASEILTGGLQLGSPAVRAEALAWCARICSSQSAPAASKWLEAARDLASSEHVTLVSALLGSDSNSASSIAEIASLKSPLSNTIRFAIHRKPSEANALNWLRDAELKPDSFDADGQCLVLQALLVREQWADAFAWASHVTGRAVEACPALGRMIAYAFTVEATPPYQRAAVLAGPPTIGELEQRHAGGARAYRLRAIELFRDFHAAASAEGLVSVSNETLEWALWLALADPYLRDAARAEIATLAAGSGRIRWAPLAVAADVLSQPEACVTEIERAGRAYGALEFESARALIATLLASPVPSWIDRWDFLSSLLNAHFHGDTLTSIHLQALAKVGRFGEAEELLERRGGELSPDVAANIARVLKATQAHALDDAQNAASNPPSRRAWISSLRKGGRLDEALQAAKALLDETETITDAEIVAQLIAAQGLPAEVASFFEEHPDFARQSENLVLIEFHALFSLGRWRDAAELVEAHRSEFADVGSVLEQIALYSGDWSKLKTLLHARVGQLLKPDALVQSALLASALDEPDLAMGYIAQAIELQPEAPELLMQGYFIAVRCGKESCPEAIQWMSAAFARASSTGPVQRKTLREITDAAPAWREQTERISASVRNAELFLGFAAASLNRPIAGLLLETLESNLLEPVAARRAALTTFAGVVRPKTNPPFQEVALDATSLLILAHFDLLPLLRHIATRILVPHATGPWLFKELEQLRFHQPSRLRSANELVAAIGNRSLAVAELSGNTPIGLSVELGADLAQLVVAARRSRESGNASFVVRPAPIYRPDSLGEIEAEAQPHFDVLCSTHAVVRALDLLGAIAPDKTAQANAYLALQDRGWPVEPVIMPGAHLYLDDLAVTYLQHLGLLDKLRGARFHVFVHPDVHQEAAALISHGGRSDAAIATIRKIQAYLASGYADGTVEAIPLNALGKDREADLEDDEAAETKGAPIDPRFEMLKQVFGTAGHAVTVIDDRAANKYMHVAGSGDAMTDLATSLDVIDWLVDTEHLSDQDRRTLHARLRAGGCVNVPIRSDQILAALASSAVIDGKLFEGFEARAIRDAVLLTQCASTILLPLEAAWLTETLGAFRTSIRELWSKTPDDEHMLAKMSWLLDTCRPAGFAGVLLGSFDPDRAEYLDAMTYGHLIIEVALGPRQNELVEWLDVHHLGPMRQERPRTFDALCRLLRTHVIDLARALRERSTKEDHEQANALIGLALNQLPKTLRAALVSDRGLLDELNLQALSRISVAADGNPEFNAEDLFKVAGEVVDSGVATEVCDKRKQPWMVSRDEDEVVAANVDGSVRFRIDSADVFSADPRRRERHVFRLLERHEVVVDKNEWLQLARTRSWSAAELESFEEDLRATPVSFISRVSEAAKSGRMSADELVPTDPRYYERMTGASFKLKTLEDLAASLAAHYENGCSDGLLQLALARSTHSALAPAALVGKLSPAQVAELAERQLPAVDCWSLIGLLEAVAQRRDALTACAPAMCRLIEKVREITHAGNPQARLSAAIATLVDGTLATSRRLPGRTVLTRRFAAFTHAALVESIVLKSDLPVAEVTEWFENSVAAYQICTLADLVTAPRWNALLLNGEQLRQEMLGRTIGALSPLRDSVDAAGLGDLVFGEDNDSLQSRMGPAAFAPGPLEGGVVTEKPFPAGDEEALWQALKDDSHPLPKRLRFVVEMCQLATPSQRILTEATLAVRDAGGASELPTGWGDLLVRLGLLSAGARNKDLAETVQWHALQCADEPFAVRVYACLAACAWTDDLALWTDNIAGAARALSREMTADEASHLGSVLAIVESMYPALTPRIAPVLARVRSFETSLA